MENFKLAHELENIIENLDNKELIKIHNEYVEKECCNEDYILEMYFLDDEFNGCTPTEIVDACKDIDTSNDFFCCTIYGYESFDNYEDFSRCCHGDIARYCVREDYDFGNDEIREFLDENKEDEE